MLIHRLCGKTESFVYLCDPGQVSKLWCAEITCACKCTCMKTWMHIECLGWAWYHTKYLSLVSVDKTGIQNNLGRTGFILFYIPCNSRLPQGTKTRTWEQELKQKPRRTVACWFSPLILYTAHIFYILPRDGTAHSGLGLSASISNQEDVKQTRP